MTFIQRVALCWRILLAKPGGLLAHAERELPPAAGDEMQTLMNQQLKELILVFCTHGHSGFSASYANAALSKLLAYKPLSPLTGDDDEWNEVGHSVFQNRRCSHVFKSVDRFDGQAYDIDAVVFRDPDGGCCTNGGSSQPITFPYTPATKYVDRGVE
jgi:hypothetical protein